MSEKIEENDFYKQKKDFLKYWPRPNCNNGLRKENMNETISFPLNRKSVANGRNKGFV